MDFMADHKVKYRTEKKNNSGCIHQCAKYAGTICRRDVCRDLKLKRKEAEVDENGNKIRRRNIYKEFDPEINVKEEKVVVKKNNGEAEKNKGEVKDGTVESVSNPVEGYKNKLRKYAENYQELNGAWFHMKNIEAVSFCLVYYLFTTSFQL